MRLLVNQDVAWEVAKGFARFTPLCLLLFKGLQQQSIEMSMMSMAMRTIAPPPAAKTPMAQASRSAFGFLVMLVKNMQG